MNPFKGSTILVILKEELIPPFFMRLILIAVFVVLQGNAVAQTTNSLFSIEMDKELVYASGGAGTLNGKLRYQYMDLPADSIYDVVLLENRSKDTLVLRNFVPFGFSTNRICITGKGEHGLSRTHLFIPGREPVNVVCPDNAWELGFTILESRTSANRAVLSRRDRSSIVQGQRRRFETVLYPGGSVKYRIWIEGYTGSWQEGLRKIFQEKKLYDVPVFNNELYHRKDLQWMRHTYVMHLIQAWDKFYYDYTDRKFHLNEFMARGKKLYGGDDVIGLWPTWPSLGLDQRNQFDLFRDLPGGTKKLRELADTLRKNNTRFFICYNPWDESTRSEGHLAGIGDLIKATSADGVVLDTRGESSRELQDAADKVRPGVIMYSEGMAVPKDMPLIVSGRVHNALYYVPMLNLNKLIKPDFAIYRVAELYKEPIRREFATSFFNGYGTELNIFAPGQPDWVEEQYRFLGQTSRILRENSSNFTDGVYTPLLSTTRDSIWVNRWEKGDKTIYTVYSILPQGFSGPLLQVTPRAGYHFVDIWHHRVPELIQTKQGTFIPAETAAFAAKDLGTNNEGAVDALAELPVRIQAKLNGDLLSVQTSGGDLLRIWAGAPSYEKTAKELKPGSHQFMLNEFFGRYEGRFVIQLLEKGELVDETIVEVLPGTPRRISKVVPAVSRPGTTSDDMVQIPSGRFTFRESHGDEFIPYPKQDVDSSFSMPAFRMDRFPVTNAQYKKFLDATRYRPADTANFLRHWVRGRIPAGQENYPVVCISYEDAQAYAKWAGKRLPTEIEWQYAAQTPALNEWPWPQTIPVRRKEEVITETLTVTSIEGIDSTVCNLGDGKPYPVGKYPRGANHYGLQDLVGCVWQLTNDVYMNGSYRYIILKGGSYFKPSSSWWYVQSGPRELHYRQFLLRISPGFERNATVGFRCIQ